MHPRTGISCSSPGPFLCSVGLYNSVQFLCSYSAAAAELEVRAGGNDGKETVVFPEVHFLHCSQRSRCLHRPQGKNREGRHGVPGLPETWLM